MQEENVLNIIMYLFQNHLQDGHKINIIPKKIFQQLEAIGFSKNSIQHALAWLESLSGNPEDIIYNSASQSTRVYNPEEKDILSTDIRGYILHLEQENILNPKIRELLIHQLTSLDTYEISMSLVQWVTLMILYNHCPDSEALERMEGIVLYKSDKTIH